MGRLLKLLFWVAAAGVVALVGYAMIAELPAPTRRISEPLPLPQTQPPGDQ